MSFKFAMASVAMLFTLLSGVSQALPSTTLYTIGTATSPIVISSPSNISISALTGYGPFLPQNLFFGAWIQTGSHLTQITTATGSNNSGPYAAGGAQVAFGYQFDFKLGPNFSPAGSPNFNLKLAANPSNLPSTADFFVQDLTTRSVVSATSSILGGNLVLSALLPHGTSDTYALTLLIPKSLSNQSNSFTITGAVPLPGTLLMFGALLVGMMGLSYKKNRQW